MIKLNTSASGAGEFDNLAEKFDTITKQQAPSFATYEPNMEQLGELAKKYADRTHIVVIGRGGSITSTEAFYKNLSWFGARKNVFLCNSTDPDFIAYIKSQCPIEKTLVISVSKSGTNIEHLENTFAFADGYAVLVVTGPETNNPLREAATVKGWEIVDHPNIGGRFSGMTESTLVPCAIIGMDVGAIVAHMKNAYEMYAPSHSIGENDALKFAAALYQLEQKGFDEIFFSIYSVQYTGFSELISQLFHETICKDELQGQTVVALLSPESQHHFSQRFYGGKHNLIGVMLNVERYADEATKTQLPKEIQDITLREGRLGDINGISLQDAIHCEYEGNKQDAIKRHIPLFTLDIQDANVESTTTFMAFLQYTAVYGAWLRGVDPFSQPHVESSKIVSFEKRKEFAVTENLSREKD